MNMSASTPETSGNNNHNDRGSDMTTDANSNTSTNEERNRNETVPRTRRGDRRQHYDDNSEQSWLGDKPEVGAVLGLRTEYLSKKVSFEVFLEKMTDYVLRELKNAADVVSVVRDMTNPSDDFAKKHMPNDLTDKQKNRTCKYRYNNRGSRCTRVGKQKLPIIWQKYTEL